MTSINIERSLGRVEGMLAQVIEHDKKAERERSEARVDRKLLYERIEKMERTCERMEKKLESQERRLKLVEEPIQTFGKWKERFIGMSLIWTIIAGSLGSVVTHYWSKIASIFAG